MHPFSTRRNPAMRIAAALLLLIGISASPLSMAQRAGQDIPDAEVHAEYDRFVAASGTTEYHVAHIMTDTQDHAQQMIDRLNQGEPFAALARKYSFDSGSAQNGGDMGWEMPTSFDPAFSEAMAKLAPGQYSAQPLRTRFGWHIIKVIETRPAKLPSFEQVEWQIRNKLAADRVK